MPMWLGSRAGSRRAAFIVSVTALVSSCAPFGDTVVAGPYRLMSIDIREDTALYYCETADTCIERVPGHVFAVGANANYITAARHPYSFDEGDVDELVTEYYFIDRQADDFSRETRDVVFGPFDRQALNEKQRALGLPPLS